MENLTCPSLETIKLGTTWFLPEIKPTVGGFSLFANKGSIESFASHRHKHTWFVHWLDTLLDGHLTDIIRICTIKGRYPAQEWKKTRGAPLVIRIFQNFPSKKHSGDSFVFTPGVCSLTSPVQSWKAETGQPTAVCWAETVRNRTKERWQDGPGFAGSHVTF